MARWPCNPVPASRSGIMDADYQAAGAEIAATAKAAIAGADVVLKVRRPAPAELKGVKKGALVIAILDPYGNEAALQALAEAGVSLLRHGVDAAHHARPGDGRAVLAGQPRRLSRRHRRGGGVWPGLSDDDDGRRHRAGRPRLHHGRRRRRPAGHRHRAPPGRGRDRHRRAARRPRSRSRSLGAKFVAVEDEEFKQAETAGGYAKEMSNDYQAKQAALVAVAHRQAGHRHHHGAHPRPARRRARHRARWWPRCGRARCIVDLAVERGGNVAGARPGEVVTTPNGVKIVGYLNVPGRLAATSSSLYARNLFAFARDAGRQGGRRALAVKWDDELVKATNITRDGAIVHPNFQPKVAEPAGLSRGFEGGGQHGERDHRRTCSKKRRPRRASPGRPPTRPRPMPTSSHTRSGRRHMPRPAARIDPFVFRSPSSCWPSSSATTWSGAVTPALHTPLMSVTNAISSVIVVGALLAVGVERRRGDERRAGLGTHLRLHRPDPRPVNIFGGFLVTQRMLAHVQEEGLRTMSINLAALL